MPTEGNHKKRKMRFIHDTNLPPRMCMMLGMFREITQVNLVGRLYMHAFFPLSAAHVRTNQSKWTACTITRILFFKPTKMHVPATSPSRYVRRECGPSK